MILGSDDGDDGGEEDNWDEAFDFGEIESIGGGTLLRHLSRSNSGESESGSTAGTSGDLLPKAKEAAVMSASEEREAAEQILARFRERDERGSSSASSSSSSSDMMDAFDFADIDDEEDDDEEEDEKGEKEEQEEEEEEEDTDTDDPSRGRGTSITATSAVAANDDDDDDDDLDDNERKGRSIASIFRERLAARARSVDDFDDHGSVEDFDDFLDFDDEDEDGDKGEAWGGGPFFGRPKRGGSSKQQSDEALKNASGQVWLLFRFSVSPYAV